MDQHAVSRDPLLCCRPAHGLCVVGVYDKGELSTAAGALDAKSGGVIRRVVRRGDFEGKAGTVLPIAELPGAPAVPDPR